MPDDVIWAIASACCLWSLLLLLYSTRNSTSSHKSTRTPHLLAMAMRYLTSKLAQQVSCRTFSCNPRQCTHGPPNMQIDEELMGSVGAFSIDQVRFHQQAMVMQR